MINMGRPSGAKNTMRTLDEKEKIVLEYRNTSITCRAIAEKYNTSLSVIINWARLYEEKGLEGLKSNTGKSRKGKGNFKKTEIQKLKDELLKKEIENMQIKKGYQVKGVGRQKEYVTIFDANMK